MKRILLLLPLALAIIGLASGVRGQGKDDKPGFIVDKAKKQIIIDAKIAPRRLEHLKGEIYPIEVIAAWAHPKGKKAHETVVTIEAMPSAIHKALEELGAKPGTPVLGGKDEPKGAEVKVYIEAATPEGETKKLTMDKVLVDNRTGKAFPKTVQWRFTGSKQVQPDPNSKDLVYGADTTGTLMVIFPVADTTVLQTNMTMEFEKFMKLDTNTKILPKEGTPVKLILEVAK
ncbi:MAG: YdjY domain-containing protein [Gemmataceae bacterium]|nr:YdjY domain-containing protein [Gemmataceae bacterium]